MAAYHGAELETTTDALEKDLLPEDLDDSEDDADVDARAYGIYKQLPVDGREPDFESGSPQTAEEYLRRVRWGPSLH